MFLTVRAGSIAVFFHEKSVIPVFFRKFPSIACFPTSKLSGRDDSLYSGMRTAAVVRSVGAGFEAAGADSDLKFPFLVRSCLSAEMTSSGGAVMSSHQQNRWTSY